MKYTHTVSTSFSYEKSVECACLSANDSKERHGFKLWRLFKKCNLITRHWTIISVNLYILQHIFWPQQVIEPALIGFFRNPCFYSCCREYFTQKNNWSAFPFRKFMCYLWLHLSNRVYFLKWPMPHSLVPPLSYFVDYKYGLPLLTPSPEDDL